MLLILFGSLFLHSCNSGTRPANSEGAEALQSPSSTSTPLVTNEANQFPDFRNFDYPICFESIPKLAPKLNRIRLTDGELELDPGDYGLTDHMLIFDLINVSTSDLNRDGIDEALVTLGLRYFQGHETAIILYDLSSNVPKVVWTRQFGDAAFGGLRKIEFTGDGLITEEYGNARARNHPTSVIRKRYRIADGKVSEVESLTTEVDLDEAEFLGFPSGHRK